ncbi:MAG: efflux RND transporter permease subunit [Oscillospiraceae bacterium]
MEQVKKEHSFMLKLATFIVDKRNLFFLITIIALIFSAFSRNWVEVENSLSFYLPEESETKQALDVMADQFTTYGTAQVMVANITYNEASDLNERIAQVKGVQSIAFDQTTEHYAHSSALFTVTFDYDETDDQCLASLDAVKELLSDYDIYVSTELGDTLAETIDAEVNVIMVYVAVIVVAVLILTSRTYGEVPVLLLTFITAMILNQGTNFLLGKISFVSNSVTSILQLALSLDYAVILCNRFKEEHRTLPIREAAIAALSKAIPEISASSLTTVGGLCAMLFMQFKIGPDMGICLMKSILFALLSVFVVMPGLLVLFGPLIEKTEHRDFIPKISFAGKFAWASRKVVPFIFLAAIVAGFFVSGRCPYAYGYSTLTTPKLNETQIAENLIGDTFTSTNMIALTVPAGDYEKEAALLTELESMEEIDYSMGLANVEAMNGYMLADKLMPRQFSELADLDYEMAQVLYAAYATEQGDYGKLMGNISSYKVPLIDMFLFVCEQADAGVVQLSSDQTAMLQDAKTQMESAKAQLQGKDYSRMLLYLTLPESGDETYAFLDTVRETAQRYYPDGNVYVAGNSSTEYDFEKSFARDNTVVSIVSLLIVLVVLLFTFKSAGMPLLLIVVIQGSIWINFSIPTLTGTGVFFMSYLVVSSIQMGANIDYAIVIASRYQEIKGAMSHREAMTESLNFAFPTVMTSGTIMTVAGILIGGMTSEAAIVGIGQSIGRGTIISMILVLFVLPQILLLGGGIADKTSFSMPSAIKQKEASGRVFVDGFVTGQISGAVSGMIRANVDGDVNLNVISGNVAECPPECQQEEGGNETK